MAANDKKWQELYERAHAAGLEAGEQAIPRPMVVVGGIPGEPEQTWVVNEGPCGFAWVVVKPGTCSFARWLRKTKRARKHYYGGMSIWVSMFGQSITRKQAYARKFAEVLQDAGIDAYAGSRLD